MAAKKLAPPPKLSDTEIGQIIRRTQVLTGGISGRTGVKVIPGPGWMAEVDKGVLMYDVGTAGLLIQGMKDGSVKGNPLTGVIVHEVAHLVDTRNYNLSKLPASAVKNIKQFQSLMNALEDRRIELRMAKRRPGFEQDFADLHALLNEKPEVKEALLQASLKVQFDFGVHSLAYGTKPAVSDRDVAKALKKHKGAIEKMVRLDTTQALADRVVSSGLWKDALRFVEAEPPQPQGKGQGQGEGGDGEPIDGQGTQGESGDGEPSDGQGKQDGDGELDGESGGGKGTDDGEEDGQGGGKNDTDKDEGDDDSGGDDGDKKADDTDGEGDDEYLVTPNPSGGSAKPKSDQIGAGSQEFTLEELAALTQHQRQALEALMGDTIQSGDAKIKDIAEKVGKKLAEMEAERSDLGEEIERRTKPRVVADDVSNESGENAARYQRIRNRREAQASTLARDLGSVLLENSFDRWSSIGHKSGPRINTKKLYRTRVGDYSVYSRRERPKNRRYAVGIALDVSGSMQGNSIRVAQEATVMVAEACERCHIDLGVYAFGAGTLCIKPFDMRLVEREGRLGAMGSLTHARIGYNTQLGNAIRRMATDLTAYGDDYQKLLIAVTDGQSGDPVVPAVKAAEDSGAECIGIGIETNAVESSFASSAVISNVDELPKLLVQTLRSRVRKG